MGLEALTAGTSEHNPSASLDAQFVKGKTRAGNDAEIRSNVTTMQIRVTDDSDDTAQAVKNGGYCTTTSLTTTCTTTFNPMN